MINPRAVPVFGDEHIHEGVSEFGRMLAQLVRRVPGALGAVLSDDLGDAVDFAYRPNGLSEVDIQLCGAQIGQFIERLARGSWAREHPIEHVLVECDRGSLLFGRVTPGYIVSLRLDRSANLGLARRHFQKTHRALLPLLR